MAGKLSFLVGLGAGYVLGARAGRERYEQMAEKAQGIWRDPRVREKADAAGTIVTEKAGEAGAKVADTVKERVGSDDPEPGYVRGGGQ
ncbi:hypothetical protein CLV56_0803 [Mumia flava]|uniref:YtxH-like protein n=1 Tax=Mumia flava TaxID=1348852 RepID=A0A2M9BFC3_9ACTN|nr:hypothetical protein [Mumia flava]PJJ56594.1 hypothetical protein CLV56_0803 [Mumia flava]